MATSGIYAGTRESPGFRDGDAYGRVIAEVLGRSMRDILASLKALKIGQY